MIDRLDKREIRELLNKGWMTHDAMWFYHCLKECGIEKTNKVNKAAVRSMAAVEIKRIKQALGMEKEVLSFEEIKDFLEGLSELIRADFMKFTFSYPSENVIRCEWEKQKCFAYQGMKKLGVIDQYQCGIFDRVEAWLDGLGVRYSVTPRVETCMMHTDGHCFREYCFSFDE